MRSGKSRFALERARSLGETRLFVATAEALDSEMEDRISRHQKERGHDFQTVEEPLELPERLRLSSGFDVVLVDCLTLWLSNLLVRGQNESQVTSAVAALLQAVETSPAHIVLVSNEVGLGIVPDSHLGRVFRDVAGAAHTRLAAIADEVYFAALGLVLRLRPGPVEAL